MTSTDLHAVVGEPADAGNSFSELEQTAMEYADAMTSGDVSDELFTRVRSHFDDDQIVELTATIAWENASARFNRALRVPSQHLWHDAC